MRKWGFIAGRRVQGGGRGGGNNNGNHGQQGGPQRALTWRHNDQVNAAGSPGAGDYTWSSVPIGPAAASRRVIVGILATSVLAGNREATSVTVGGVAATFLFRIKGSSAVTLELWIASVPTGTTATIAVVWDGACTRGGITVWSAVGLNSATPVDTETMDNVAFTTTNTGMALTTTPGGVALAYVYTSNSTGITWTNATERFDVAVSAPRIHSAADASTPGNSLTITGTPTANDANAGALAAAFF